MLPEERDAAYLWDMLSAAREVSDMLKGLTLEQFQAQRVLMRATERCIEIIGEAARRVSSTTRQLQPEYHGLISSVNETYWLTNMARSITSFRTKPQPRMCLRS